MASFVTPFSSFAHMRTGSAGFAIHPEKGWLKLLFLILRGVEYCTIIPTLFPVLPSLHLITFSLIVYVILFRILNYLSSLPCFLTLCHSAIPTSHYVLLLVITNFYPHWRQKCISTTQGIDTVLSHYKFVLDTRLKLRVAYITRSTGLRKF